MEKARFITKIKELNKQTLFAWILLHISIVLFATISTLITVFDILNDRDNIIFTTLVVCIFCATILVRQKIMPAKENLPENVLHPEKGKIEIISPINETGGFVIIIQSAMFYLQLRIPTNKMLLLVIIGILLGTNHFTLELIRSLLALLM